MDLKGFNTMTSYSASLRRVEFPEEFEHLATLVNKKMPVLYVSGFVAVCVANPGGLVKDLVYIPIQYLNFDVT